MARVLGYGGLANTNGARDFSGKTESVSSSDDFFVPTQQAHLHKLNALTHFVLPFFALLLPIKGKINGTF